MQNVEFNEIPTVKDSSPNKDIGVDFYQQDQTDPNPFGKQINQDTLKEANKQIAEEKQERQKVPPVKKMGLAIEIDENEDYDTAHNKAQNVLNDQLTKMEERVSIVSNDVEEFTEEEILTEFSKLYQQD